MKKTVGLLACAIGASSLHGAITTVSDVADMPASGVEGRIEYNGPTATAAASLALTPAANKAATLRVVPSGTELTFSGMLSVSGGAFVKSGPGLLSLLYPGAFKLGESEAGTPNADLTWDSDGVASKGFTSLTVADGTLEIGAPGSVATVKGATTVGARYAAGSAPVLRVTGGTFKSSVLYPDRGYSTSSRTLVPTFEVSNCATAVFNNVYTESGNNSSHVGRAVISSTGAGALLKVTGYCSLGLSRSGTNTLNTSDGSMFQHTAGTMDHSARVGLEIGGTEANRGGGVRTRRTVWNIDGGTGSAYAAYLNRGSEINVKNGGVLKLDRSMMYFMNQTNDWQRGALGFDGGTIRNNAARVAEWFTGITNYTVGAQGMKIVSPADLGSLDGHSSFSDATAAETAEILVEGDGTLVMGAGEVPVRLKEGRLIMGVNGRHMGSSATGRIRVENGSSLVVAGENSLQNMVFEGGAATNRFRHQGIEADRMRWRTSGHAGFLADGSIRLGTREWVNSTSCAYLADKLPVDESFSVSWTYFGSGSGSKNGVPYGVTAVFRNGAHLMCGSSAAECCYDGVTSSVAVSYDALRKNLKFGQNGVWGEDLALDAASVGWATDPVRCSVSYDAEAEKLVFSAYQPTTQKTYSRTNSVNLAEATGGNEAYFGFLSGTTSEYCGFHVIGDVRISGEQGRGYQKTGGMVEIAAGKTWKQELLADTSNLGFVMNGLSYGDGAMLISTSSGVTGLPADLHSSVNLGFDSVSGTGGLVKYGNAGFALSAPGAARGASVDLREGSVILRKENMEPPSMTAADGGWCFTGSEIYWTGARTLQFGPLCNARGTSAQADPERVMNANTRRRYRVDGAWKISFRVFATSADGGNNPGFSFLLHNDPSGCETRSTGLCGGNRFQNAACFRFWTGKDFVFFGNATSGNNAVNGTTAISFADIVSLKEKDSQADVEIEHDPDADTVKVTITQGSNVFSHTWEGIDLESMIGGEKRAYLSFGAHGHQTNPTVFRISGFAFSDVGAVPVEEDAEVPYFGTLTATGATVRVVLDSSVSDANYRLADNLNLAAESTVRVSAVKAPGVLDLGTCASVETLGVYLNDGCGARISGKNGASLLRVDGGTLSVSAADALEAGCALELYNGAKVRYDGEGVLRVKKITVSGVRIPAGSYSGTGADWLDAESGVISTGSSLRLIFR